MSTRTYPKYKDSGVEWLGTVPEHWEVKRLGHYFNERREKVSDKDFPALSVTKNGIVPQLETAAKTDDGDNRKRVCNGDFVINSRSDRKGSSGASALGGSVSLINTVLQPEKTIDSQFVHLLLRSQPFQEEYYRYGKGIVADLWSTNYSEMKNIVLAVPPLAEQRAIAAFLDRETARLDTLIARQERLIELSLEKRRALISHTVTRGLNANAPLKDSGVEWLGEVPQHWEVMRLKNSIEFERNGVWGNEPNEDENDLVCVRVADFDRHRFKVGVEKLTTRNITASEQANRILEKDDLLLEKSGGGDSQPVGCVVLFDHKFKAVCSNFVARLKPSASADSRFFVYVHAMLYNARMNVRSIKQTTVLAFSALLF